MTTTVPPKEIDFSFAYGFADFAVKAALFPNDYDLDESIFPDFFNFREKSFFERAGKPCKQTLLHDFIHNVNHLNIDWHSGKIDPQDIPEQYGPLIESARIQLPAWFIPSKIEAHMDECSDLLKQASEISTEAAFQILFADRSFLFQFNKAVARSVAELRSGEDPIVVADGEIKRATYFPVWLKTAVFHRDKGRCQLCGADLTNLLVPVGQRHFDHMVPLKSHGTNDSTNIQLTCKSCNSSKQANVVATKHVTYPYW